MQQIAFLAPPFFIGENDQPKDIIDKVKAGGLKPYRPTLRLSIEEDMKKDMEVLTSIMKRCWSENPNNRPTFSNLANEIKNFELGQDSELIDHVVDKLEKYARSLEQIVKERTAELNEERANADKMRLRTLPESVAEQLKNGEPVPPKIYKSVTIFFSDIVGFTWMCSTSTPQQVIDFLNDLCAVFDDIIGKHDVYKV